MSVGLAVAIAGTAVTSVIGLAGIAIALVARKDASDATAAASAAAEAAKRSADAAEAQVALTRQQIEAAAARSDPRAHLEVLNCSPAGGEARQGWVRVSFIVQNRSTEPDLLQDVAVTYENAEYWKTHIDETTLTGGNLPLPLVPDEPPIRLDFYVPTGKTLFETNRLPAQLTIRCKRAGRVVEDFTIFQP